ncbi:MAG TPA: CAP domain-containing protein [Thermoleophilaceae bacterium]|nr:CAP domain-containing protein [Thermoleophilaceae bacterium]
MALRLAVACVAMTVLIPSEAPAAGNGRAAERAMVDAVNDARQRHGLRPLRDARPLARSAGRLALGLTRLGVFGHLGAGASAGSRSWGEALAVHRGWRARARPTVKRWLRSPSHRAVLLGGFRRIGAGIRRGRLDGRLTTVWVLHATGR